MLPNFLIIFKPKKLFDKINEFENQGNPKNKLEIRNSINAKINGVKIIKLLKLFVNLYIKNPKPKNNDKKIGNNKPKIANGFVDS